VLLVSWVAGLVGFGTAAAQPPSQTPKSPNGLVINEVFDSQTAAQEYFELYNTSSANINLSTYVIYNHDGYTPLSRLTDPNIASGQIRAIGPSQLLTPTIGGPTGLARTDFLGLVNTSPSDTVIDVVNWGNAPDISWPYYDRFSAYFFISGTQPFLPEDNPKTLQRWPDGRDTDTANDWQLIARSPAAFSCDDPFEDDDSLTTAANQNPNTTNLHRICAAADNDYISINMSASFTYTLQAVAVGTRVDLATRLYDSAGAILAEDNPAGTRNSTIVFRPTSTATFRVQVYDANNAGSSGPDWLYNFTITQQSASTPTPAVAPTNTPISCNDRYEPDNSLNEAGPIDLNTEQVHTLCRLGTAEPDTDWVRFTVNGGKVYSLYTKDLSGPVDTIITLFDAEGNRLAENDDYQPGSGLASRIDYTFPGTATYFLRIRDKRGLNGAGYQYTVGFSSTGALPPTATSTVSPTPNPNSPTPTTGPCTDAFEPDGVAEAARTLLIGSTQNHSMCPATDADWVRFYARAGKVYTIRTGSLGVGLDTYMFLFDSDSATILAQNDDGGDGVASRIDFYPQRDDWYFVQVKNAGDLGLPEMTYDLSLAVVPGVPQPPGTATPIIAPIETVTSGPQPPQPTAVVQPTKPPVPTPTQGAILPTPPAAAEPTQAPPGPKPTNPAPVEPTAVVQPPTAEPTLEVPGVPGTGHEDPKSNGAKGSGASGGGTGSDPVIVVGAPQQPEAPQPPAQSRELAPMLFRIFYDLNRNDTFNKGEGVRGISVYFLDAANNLAPTGSLTTSQGGDASVKIPTGPQRVYIPYLGINMPLTRFPERELHSIWMQPVQLPDRVP
jgi:hypothetical protein